MSMVKQVFRDGQVGKTRILGEPQNICLGG